MRITYHIKIFLHDLNRIKYEIELLRRIYITASTSTLLIVIITRRRFNSSGKTCINLLFLPVFSSLFSEEPSTVRHGYNSKMKLLFALFLLVVPSVFAAHLYVKEAGYRGKLGPKLANGFQFCPTKFSARGFSVMCAPRVMQPGYSAKWYINDRDGKMDWRSPFSIAGDNRIMKFVGQWYSFPTTAKITCAILNSNMKVVEKVMVTGSFSCGAVPSLIPATVPVATTLTSARVIPINSKYCVTKNATSHVNVRPANWVATGTSLTYKPLSNCRRCWHRPTTANLVYKFRVPVKSHYALTMVSTTTHPTFFNDLWIKFRSLSLNGFHKVTKARRSVAPKTAYIKVYQNAGARATAAFSVDHNPHSLSTTQQLVPGVTYTITVGARSDKFQLDKLILFPCSGNNCWGYSGYFLRFSKVCSA